MQTLSRPFLTDWYGKTYYFYDYFKNGNYAVHGYKHLWIVVISLEEPRKLPELLGNSYLIIRNVFVKINHCKFSGSFAFMPKNKKNEEKINGELNGLVNSFYVVLISAKNFARFSW